MDTSSNIRARSTYSRSVCIYGILFILCIIARILLSPTSSINILSNILARVEYNAYLVV